MLDNPIIFLIILTCVFIYFLPSVIVSGRNHHNKTSLYLLNLLLGWTFLGWVAALVWAFSAQNVSVNSVNDDVQTANNESLKVCKYCAEDIKIDAVLCKHCGSNLIE
jgi:hypothetical protein